VRFRTFYVILYVTKPTMSKHRSSSLLQLSLAFSPHSQIFIFKAYWLPNRLTYICWQVALYFHNVVQEHPPWDVDNSVALLLEIYSGICKSKIIEMECGLWKFFFQKI